ncbi:unnamed protein product, partial [Larinioides sclopetarius]
MTIIRSQLSHSRDNDISKTQKTSFIMLRFLKMKDGGRKFNYLDHRVSQTVLFKTNS